MIHTHDMSIAYVTRQLSTHFLAIYTPPHSPHRHLIIFLPSKQTLNHKMAYKFNTNPLALLFLLGFLVMVHFTQAQNLPQDYVNAHNNARSQVGVGPISWDDSVAAFAQSYARQRAGDCLLQHSGSQQYGENIAIGGGSGFDFTGQNAVNLWVQEQKDYDYKSNTCAPGKVCGHYTQVVWRNSVRVGCARVQCNSGQWFITCNYSPPGNYINQRPY